MVPGRKRGTTRSSGPCSSLSPKLHVSLVELPRQGWRAPCGQRAGLWWEGAGAGSPDAVVFTAFAVQPCLLCRGGCPAGPAMGGHLLLWVAQELPARVPLAPGWGQERDARS